MLPTFRPVAIPVLSLVGCADVHGRRAGGPGSPARRRMDDLRRRSRQPAVPAVRSDQPRQLQGPRSGLALQDGRPRAAAGVQFPVHAADGERRPVHDRRYAPRRRRARCGDRRDAVDAPRRRGQARRGRAAPAVGTRAGLLDRRPRGADRLRHARLPDDRARREDRPEGSRVRPQRRRRSQARDGPDDRSRDGRDRAARGADHLRQHDRRRRGAPAGRRARRAGTTRRATSAATTRAPASGCGSSTRFRRRASSATTRGSRTRGRTPATSASGRR